MDVAFENKKNSKALVITLLVCLALVFISKFIHWYNPPIIPPAFEEGIEVNLGNSETGLGEEIPSIPGEAAPTASETANTTSNSSVANNENTVVPSAVNSEEDEPITIPAKKPTPKTTPTNNITPKPTTTPTNNTSVTKPIPAPKPKAVFANGTGKGNGGNDADSYNGVNSQGIAGGKGDQGNPNGNVNSDSYTGSGGSGKSGFSISKGLNGRKLVQLPSFEDDFNESAKVFVDITVNQAGQVTAATINPRGTTTTNAQIRAIAKKKAMQLKLNASSGEEQTGTIVFNFQLRG